MHIYRKLIILFIIIIFSYIIYRLIQKRKILLLPPNKEGFGFGYTTEASESTSIQNTDTGPNISNLNIATSNLPIREYEIKSSYNTAYSGSFVGLDTIKYVLSRGCRFLDFEVYMIDSKVCVAQSNDLTHINSQNHLLLDEVLSCVSIYAFTAPSPNPLDPLFLQLRINSHDQTIFKSVAMSVDLHLNAKLYTDASGNRMVLPSTLIGDLIGKIVLIVDKSISPDYNLYPDCSQLDASTKCYNLDNYVNLIAGSESLRTSKFNSLMDRSTTPYNVNDDDITTDVTILKMATPDIDSINLNNPVPAPFISNYGVQIIGFRFYKNDTNLANYELLFSENKSAFVSLATIYIVITSQGANAAIDAITGQSDATNPT